MNHGSWADEAVPRPSVAKHRDSDRLPALGRGAEVGDDLLSIGRDREQTETRPSREAGARVVTRWVAGWGWWTVRLLDVVLELPVPYP